MVLHSVDQAAPHVGSVPGAYFYMWHLEQSMASEFASSEQQMVEALEASRRQSGKRDEPAHPGRRRWLALAGVIILLALATAYHYLIYLPQPDQPHWLTFLDDYFALGIAALITLAGLALGRRLLRPFPLTSFSRLERGALAIGLGWGVLSLGVLALGLAHLLYAWALLAGLLLVLLACWREVRQPWRFLTTSAWNRLPERVRPQGFFERALVWPLLFELALLAIHYLTPYPTLAYDLYQYHFAVPSLYLFHHAIYAFPGWAHANFPFTDEMLNTLALAFQAPIAALMLQGVFSLLAVLLIAGYLYRHAGRLAAWLGVALCFSSPLYIGLITNGYVELALTYYAVASLVVILAWLEQSEQMGASGTLRLLLLSGLLVGFGLATKYTEAQLVLGIGFLLIGALALNLWRVWRNREQRGQALRRGSIGLLLYVVGSLAPLLPWLAKDWALLGNPVYPFIWGGPGWDAARTQVGVVTFAHFGPRGPLWQRLALAFFGLFFDTQHTGEPDLQPPNYLLLSVLVAPALLYGEWLRRYKGTASSPPKRRSSKGEYVAPWLIVAGIAYLAWALSQALVGRYAMPWLLFLAVPAAVVLLRLLRIAERTVLSRAAVQAAILGIFLVLGPLLTCLYVLSDDPLLLVTGQVSLQQWEKHHIMEPAYWAMVQYVNTHVPRSAKVLLLGRGTGYFLEGRDYIADSGEDWIPYLETEGRTPAGILALLRQDGFRYVIYDDKTLSFVVLTYENSYLASFLPAFQQFRHDMLRQVWSYQNFHVYQVPSP